ncbi:Gfo/Idh/MocA family protein [Tropicimonas sp. S265A]|uniref:Gfo/Idh/MocA family protein n=1 Tax=Tropicimonas sp. S265A TaxID=3415134 RepID=UPI003C7AEC69
MAQLKWGLIGASNIASGHMIAAMRATGGSVNTVLSSDAARGIAYADENDIPHSTTDLDHLLARDDVNAVYISTTNEKHKDQALAAIAAGKHVLCEKPLAMTVADAVAMVRAAQAAGVTFATNHHLRNAGTHLAMREAVQAGRVGEVQAVRVFHAVYLPEHLQGWRLDNPAAGGGVIPDIVVHDADTVRFHLGEDPESVVAQDSVAGLGKGVEDSVMSAWQMPSGALVQTHEGFTIRYAGSGFEIHGSEGSIIARNVMTQQPIGTVVLRSASGEEAISYSDHNLYERALTRFAEAVSGNGAPAATGVDGVKSLAVAAAVKEAATTGTRVTVDYGGI